MKAKILDLNNNTRDFRIDLLRFIGVMMIILAHCSPGEILFQIRNFDVPMMVLISGMSFKISYKENISLKNYIWKRIKRLVFPVWIFLSFFFLLTGLILNDPFSTYKIINSYLLLGGIGYVWIIRVFLLVALVAPFLFKIEKKIVSNRLFFLMLLLSFLSFEIFTKETFNYFNSSSFLQGISGILFYIIPYSLIYLFGIRIYSLSKSYIIKMSIVFLMSFIVISTILFINENRFVYTQEYKNPLSFYYLSYSLFISLIIWRFSEKIWDLISDKFKKLILFVSENSIWIYLWHIPLIYIINKTNFHYSIEFFFVFTMANLICLIQVSIIKKYILPNTKAESSRKTIKTLFTG